MVCVSTDMEHAVSKCVIIFYLPGSMEAILEEECLREKKLREYEQGRAEVTRTLLSQLVFFNGFHCFRHRHYCHHLSSVICPISICAVCIVLTKFVILFCLYILYVCEPWLAAVAQL
jgi:hypothetical protein